MGVELLNSERGATRLPSKPNSEYHETISGVSPRGISFAVERETTQIAC
jgi:hypothetical protein